MQKQLMMLAIDYDFERQDLEKKYIDDSEISIEDFIDESLSLNFLYTEAVRNLKSQIFH